MFNDLTDNQESSSGVDDIFAETDKALKTGDNIETRQVGLSATTDVPQAQEAGVSAMPEIEEEGAGSGKFLKIAIIAVVVAILILGGYLIYTNFLSGETDVIDENKTTVVDEAEKQVDVIVGTENKVDTIDNTQANNQNNDQNNFVVPIVDQEESSTTANVGNETGNEAAAGNDAVTEEVDPMTVDSDGDGLSDYDEVNIYTTNPNLIDTDFDGLSDYDEVITYKTNPLIADTDKDGLTDYEEVKVYGTDPLNPDTDGDTYLDGAEVKGGYDPLDGNGGRLPGF